MLFLRQILFGKNVLTDSFKTFWPLLVEPLSSWKCWAGVPGRGGWARDLRPGRAELGLKSGNGGRVMSGAALHYTTLVLCSVLCHNMLHYTSETLHYYAQNYLLYSTFMACPRMMMPQSNPTRNLKSKLRSNMKLTTTRSLMGKSRTFSWFPLTVLSSSTADFAEDIFRNFSGLMRFWSSSLKVVLPDN